MNNKHAIPLADGNIEKSQLLQWEMHYSMKNQMVLPLSLGSVHFQFSMLITTISDNNLTPGQTEYRPGVFAHAPLELKTWSFP